MLSAYSAGLGWDFDLIPGVSNADVNDAIRKFGKKACNAITDPRVQLAAQMAQATGDPRAAAMAYGVQAGAVLCALEAAGGPQPGGVPPAVPPQGDYPLQARQWLATSIVQEASRPGDLRVIPLVPEGSIAALDPKIGKYRVAVPVGAQLSGHLGQGFIEIPPSSEKPANAEVVSVKEFEDELKPPLYRRPVFWIAVGGSVLALGTGAYFLLRVR